MWGPTRRASQEVGSVIILPIEMTITSIHEDYIDKLYNLRSALDGMVTTKMPTAPLAFSRFFQYRVKWQPTLKVAKIGSDFCDLCTPLTNDLCQLHKLDPRHDAFSTLFLDHRNKATNDHEYYHTCLKRSASINDGSIQNVFFDFA